MKDTKKITWNDAIRTAYMRAKGWPPSLPNNEREEAYYEGREDAAKAVIKLLQQ